MRATRIVSALAVLLATTGGSCSPPGPEPVRPPDGTGIVTAVNDPDARRNSIDVPTGMRPRSIEFADADTGYLLFADCAGRCRGALYVTFDGGQSWLNRPLPGSEATSLRLDVVDARTVVLVTGATTDWYVSTDSGRTFTAGGTGLPPAAQLQRGVGTTGCAGAGCAAQVLTDGRPVPVQPALRGDLRAAARGGSGPIWAVAASGATVWTARTGDDGRTWQPFGPPLTVSDATTLRLDVSPDGADVWLSAGPAGGYPAVYVAEAAGWRLVTPRLERTTSAAAGDGVLAVTRSWVGYLYRDGHLGGRIFPQEVDSLRTLRDGTLAVTSDAGTVWLGTGTGASRDWVQVRVDPV